jgi:hypothetical protein
MKTLKRNSLALPRSPQLVLSPSMAHVNAACRTDFVSFVRKCFHVLSPSAIFYMNCHICAIAYHLVQVWLGNIKRLIITVPPRSLKSIMCSVAFPAFVLGHDPTKRLIVVSYSADLATKHANDFRAVVRGISRHFSRDAHFRDEEYPDRARHQSKWISARPLG